MRYVEINQSEWHLTACDTKQPIRLHSLVLSDVEPFCKLAELHSAQGTGEGQSTQQASPETRPPLSLTIFTNSWSILNSSLLSRAPYLMKEVGSDWSRPGGVGGAYDTPPSHSVRPFIHTPYPTHLAQWPVPQLEALSNPPQPSQPCGVPNDQGERWIFNNDHR